MYLTHVKKVPEGKEKKNEYQNNSTFFIIYIIFFLYIIKTYDYNNNS